MDALTVFGVSLVPGLLWVWFFYRQDREREPVRVILWTFFAGMLAVVPAALLEFPFRDVLANPPDLLVRLITAVAVIGIAEEGAKLLAVYFAAFRNRAFDQIQDGIIYGVTASLGFAALENLLYVTAFGLSVAPARAIVTSLAHASFGGIAGLYLGLAKVRPEHGLATVLRGLGIAAGLHGIYDFLILARLVHPIVAIAMVYLSYRFVSAKIRQLNETGGVLS